MYKERYLFFSVSANNRFFYFDLTCIFLLECLFLKIFSKSHFFFAEIILHHMVISTVIRSTPSLFLFTLTFFMIISKYFRKSDRLIGVYDEGSRRAPVSSRRHAPSTSLASSSSLVFLLPLHGVHDAGVIIKLIKYDVIADGRMLLIV